jgi:hypothetical protein
MQIPLPGTYPVIQKIMEVQCYQFSVTSVAWATAIPSQFFLILLFQTSLLDWESWKINVKIGVGPLKGPSWGANKRQKSVMQ